MKNKVVLERKKKSLKKQMFKMELDVSQLNNKKKPEHLILRYKGCGDPKVVFTHWGGFPKNSFDYKTMLIKKKYVDIL